MSVFGGHSMAAMVWALRNYGNVGPRAFSVLMAHFRTITAIFQAELDELNAINGLGEKRSRKIYECSKYLEEAEKFIASLPDQHIQHSTIYEESYPSILMELNDPPPMLFYRGRLPDKDEKRVAIIGSRNASSEGIQNAVTLASRLAEQSVSIVSGLAQGIDAAAHVGALKAGGRSYAMLGSGFDHISPKENLPLAIELVRNGGLISEYPPDTRASASRLVSRNRLTTGLSQAVVVGEILPDSTGTLDCARFCNQIGKLTFVLIEGCDEAGRDSAGVEKVIAIGAIPIMLADGIDMIVKSLV
ncbi:MAG: DNA-processing protein DprA [Candidatus Zixiibacteriota bacterium]|nr:MAG: DNA-processing protein DprA [candidate division Zixibacteria bacterium]